MRKINRGLALKERTLYCIEIMIVHNDYRIMSNSLHKLRNVGEHSVGRVTTENSHTILRCDRMRWKLARKVSECSHRRHSSPSQCVYQLVRIVQECTSCYQILQSLRYVCYLARVSSDLPRYLIYYSVRSTESKIRFYSIASFQNNTR
jgi:hypothetical protein